MRGSMTISLTPGVGPAGKHVLPGLTAIGGLVETPLTALRPQGTLSGDPDHVRVSRIDENPADVLGFLQTHVLPGLPAIDALVHAIAVSHMPAADVLAGTHPDNVGVARVEGHITEGIGPLIVEDGLPCRSRIGRLPEIAATHSDVPDRRILRMDSDIGDAARHQSRPYIANFQAGKRLGFEQRTVFFRLADSLFGTAGRSDETNRQNDETRHPALDFHESPRQKMTASRRRRIEP